MPGFLSLPREIRDMIYDLCFVRDKIEFEEFYTDETPEEWMRGRRPESLTLHLAKPNEKPLLEYNGVGFVHRVESLTPIDGRSRFDDILYRDRTRSYRIYRGTIDPPCLSIFHTNSFVYKEAASVFYGKNVFTFPSKRCEVTLNACSAFLRDRPEHALPYIKNIHLTIGYADFLDLGESCLYSGAHYPTVKRLGDTLRHFVRLDHLRLLIEEQYPTDEILKKTKTDLGYVRLYKWMEGLRGINVPKILEIECINRIFWWECHKSWLKILISDMTDIFPLGDLNYISSPLNIRNAKGEELFSTRVVYQHQAKAG